MGILDRLMSVGRGSRSEAMAFEQERRRLSELTVQAMLEAHLNWRKHLEDFIEGRGTQNLDMDMAMRDNLCEMGKWIYGEGTRSTLSLHPEFQRLRESHRAFHVHASRVLQTFRMRGVEAARELLGKEFDQKSKEIIATLAALIERERAMDQ